MTNAQYFVHAQDYALCVFGIAAAIYMRFAHRFKAILILGLFIRLLYVVALLLSGMIRSHPL